MNNCRFLFDQDKVFQECDNLVSDCLNLLEKVDNNLFNLNPVMQDFIGDIYLVLYIISFRSEKFELLNAIMEYNLNPGLKVDGNTEEKYHDL